MNLTILYVEDHRLVADTVRDALEAEGWRVVSCFDGAAALTRIASGARYDLLITDNHLPHVNGLEVVRYARSLKSRAELPIIMFSATECAAEAYQAGVNVFLRKPGDVARLIPAINQLFAGTS
ncbi:MAG TPA: response regulator [Pyrinomonadaceae bacterium]|jgi:two-component system chemotaxis response regulator CheY